MRALGVRPVASLFLSTLIATTFGIAWSPVPAAAAPAAVDLRVTYTGNTSVKPGATFVYRLELTNSGNVATPLPEKVGVWGVLSQGFTIASVKTNRADVACNFNNNTSIMGEQPWASLSCLTKYPIGPGEVVVVTAKVTAPGQVGNRQFSAVADPQGVIAESDEGNNVALFQFSVQ